MLHICPVYSSVPVCSIYFTANTEKAWKAMKLKNCPSLRKQTQCYCKQNIKCLKHKLTVLPKEPKNVRSCFKTLVFGWTHWKNQSFPYNGYFKPWNVSGSGFGFSSYLTGPNWLYTEVDSPPIGSSFLLSSASHSDAQALHLCTNWHVGQSHYHLAIVIVDPSWPANQVRLSRTIKGVHMPLPLDWLQLLVLPPGNSPSSLESRWLPCHPPLLKHCTGHRRPHWNLTQGCQNHFISARWTCICRFLCLHQIQQEIWGNIKQD